MFTKPPCTEVSVEWKWDWAPFGCNEIMRFDSIFESTMKMRLTIEHHFGCNGIMRYDYTHSRVEFTVDFHYIIL